MPLVALFWTQDRILVAIARSLPGRIQFERAVTVELLRGPDEQSYDASRLGEKIKAVLHANGVSKGDATVVVSRNDVELRQFELPPVPDEELPDLVRFQARTQFTNLTDDWLLDYIPIATPGKPSRSVLAAAISPEKFSDIRRTIEPTGLRLKHVVVRPFAAAELCRSKNQDSSCQIIVEPSDLQANISVVDDGFVLFTRTVRVPKSYTPEEFDAWLPGEIHRTIGAARNQSDAPDVTKVIVCGKAGDHQHLLDGLVESLEIETEVFDPFKAVHLARGFKSPDKFDGFASLLGSIVQQTSTQNRSLDFLNPRRTVESTELKRRLQLGGTIAAAVVIIGLLTCWWILRSKDSQIRELAADIDQLRTMTSTSDVIVKRVGVIDKWKIGDVQWLDELYELSSRFPIPDNAILNSFRASQNRDVAKIELKGFIRDTDTHSELNDQLQERPYQLDINTISNPAGNEFGVGFVQDLKLPEIDISKLGKPVTKPKNTGSDSNEKSADPSEQSGSKSGE